MTNLHSTMYLLNRVVDALGDVANYYLHSTMYLLNHRTFYILL